MYIDHAVKDLLPFVSIITMIYSYNILAGCKLTCSTECSKIDGPDLLQVRTHKKKHDVHTTYYTVKQ